MGTSEAAAVEWEVLVRDGIGLAFAGDVALVLWNAPARAHRIRWIFETTEARSRKLPNGGVALQVILPTATPPDAEGRAENAKGLARMEGLLRRMVTVPVGDDLTTRIVRTVMRGMFLVQRQSDRQFVCAKTSEGVSELLKGAGPRTPPRSAIEQGISELYRAMGIAREE